MRSRCSSLPRDTYVLATKVLLRMGPGHNQIGLSRSHIMQGVDASLKRLQVDHIDLYQIHGRDPFTPLEETLDALDDCVRAGKVRYLGLCNLSAWEITKSLWISDKKNLARFESLQMYYSVAGRDIEREIVPLAQGPEPRDHAVESARRRIALGQVLAREREARRRAPRHARFPAGGSRARCGASSTCMRPIAADNLVSVAQVALAWLLAQPHVTSVIIGAKNQEQLLDNIAATELELSPEQIQAITRCLGAAERIPAVDARAPVGRPAGQVNGTA